MDLNYNQSYVVQMHQLLVLGGVGGGCMQVPQTGEWLGNFGSCQWMDEATPLEQIEPPMPIVKPKSSLDNATPVVKPKGFHPRHY